MNCLAFIKNESMAIKKKFIFYVFWSNIIVS